MPKPKKLTATLTRTPRGWRATCVEDTAVSVAMPTPRSAKTQFRNRIVAKYGEVEIEHRVELPAEQQERLLQLRTLEEQFAALSEALPRAFNEAALSLASIGFTHVEAAALLGVQTATVTKALHRVSSDLPSPAPSMQLRKGPHRRSPFG
jgi:hypothetical protein